MKLSILKIVIFCVHVMSSDATRNDEGRRLRSEHNNQQQQDVVYKTPGLSYMKSKQIDCGQVDMQDELTDVNDNVLVANEDDNIDELKLVANLTYCLQLINEFNFNSFSIRHSGRLNKYIFERYFKLDEMHGLVYLKRAIDREALCVHVENERKSSMDQYTQQSLSAASSPFVVNYAKRPSKSSSKAKKTSSRQKVFRRDTNERTLDELAPTRETINCECNSENCEFKFKFIGFKSRHSRHVSNKNSANMKRQSVTHNIYRYLSLGINVKDVNDNRPKFLKNFLNLSITEHTSSQLVGPASASDTDRRDRRDKIECPYSKTFLNAARTHPDTDQNNILNNLIMLERAVDPDVGKNSKIDYKLILLNNEQLTLINEIENESNLNLRTSIVRNLVKNDVKYCTNLFELVETSLNGQTDEYYNYEVNEPDVARKSSSSEKTSPSSAAKYNNNHQPELLFLKINTVLDREKQSVYNFMLIAYDGLDSAELEKLRRKSYDELIDGGNYLFVRLKVNDLNDNAPKFTQSKYVFQLNETTEYKIHYHGDGFSYLHEQDVMYFNHLLNQTCRSLTSRLRVSASDPDEGLNSLIKYRLLQQIHLKRQNFGNFQLAKEERHHHRLDGTLGVFDVVDNVDSSMFTIDERDGSIRLLICDKMLTGDEVRPIDRDRFVELTNFLNYESYLKHILVVEAIDSSRLNPLQSVVTLEINLVDLNDNRPFVVSLFSRECARPADGDMTAAELNISVDTTASAVTIRGLRENTPVGRCLGQYMISDADTPNQNRHLKATVVTTTDQTSFPIVLFTNVNDEGRNRISNHNPGMDINYDLIKTGQTNEIFELVLNVQPDAEMQSTYEVKIQLTDHGHPLSLSNLVTLVVHVEDENDNVPKFRKSFYNFSIDEWNALNDELNSTVDYHLCIGKIEATDLDVDRAHSTVVYSLKVIRPIEHENLFYIHATTGNICVTNRTLLDREYVNKYELVVTALDSANSLLNSSIPVYITLVDVNDNRPEFVQAEYTFYAAEKDTNLVDSLLVFDGRLADDPGFVAHRFTMNHIGSVRAIDRDLGSNAELLYYINAADDNDKAYFELNNNVVDATGEYFQPDYAEISQQSNEETNVYDSYDNEFSDNIVYEVTAIRHSSNASTSLINGPKPANKTNILTESEYIFGYSNSEQQQQQQQVKHSLNESGKKKVLKLVNNLNDFIFVNATTGDIYLLKNMDREKILNLKFTVHVRDQPTDDHLTNSVEVNLEIIDINDSAPVCSSLNFDSDSSTATIRASSNHTQSRSSHVNTLPNTKQIDAFSMRLDLARLDTLKSTYKLAKLYKFNCFDNDLHKNARLKYEIVKVYVKDAHNEPIKKRKKHKTSVLRLRGGGSANNLDSKSVNDFFAQNRVFELDSNSGVLYLNLSLDWSISDPFVERADGSYAASANTFINKFRWILFNKYLLIKVKVSDHGIVSLFNYYYLKFYVCFINSDETGGGPGSGETLGHCDFFKNDRKNRTILLKPVYNLNTNLDYSRELDTSREDVSNSERFDSNLDAVTVGQSTNRISNSEDVDLRLSGEQNGLVNTSNDDENVTVIHLNTNYLENNNSSSVVSSRVDFRLYILNFLILIFVFVLK